MRAAAFAVALVGALAFGPAAAVGAPAVAMPGSAVIDPDHAASLTLHAVENDSAGGHPFAGVAFTIRPVTDIDLGTTTGWAQAFTLSSEFDASDPETSITSRGHLLGAPLTRASGAGGTVAFTGLAIGAYLVTETIPSLDGVSTMAPFVVLLPVTNALGTGWSYDLELTPKNDVVPEHVSPGFATKSVDDPDGHRIGDLITWHITGRILPGGDVLWWREVDALDPRLEYVGVRAWLSDGTPLVEGADYEMRVDDATNTVTFEVLGPAGTRGLDRLTQHKAADPGTQVEIDLVTRVLDASTIPNQAIVNTAIWDDPVGIVRTADPTTSVATITPADPWFPPIASLPFTGVDVLLPAMLGAALMTSGFFIVIAVRRRRRDAERAAA